MDQSKKIVPNWVLLATAAFAFVAIADIPYGYYRVRRWVVCAVAIASALRLKDSPGWMWGMGFVAVVFNPIAPIHFDKTVWRVLDGGTGLFFLLALRKIKQRHDEN